MTSLRNHKHVATALSDLGACVVLAALLTTMMVVMGGHRDPARHLGAAYLGNLALSACITISFELGMGLLKLAQRHSVVPAVVRYALAAVGFFACILLGIELAFALMDLAFPATRLFFPRGPVTLVAIPVSAVMLVVGSMRRQREAAKEAEARALEGLSEARLRALSARTHPHFLFNALNGIAELIEEDPRAGERAVLELARLFRYVLEGSDARTVPLSQELAFVRGYLAMEALRFGERLTSELDVPAALEAWPIPPLVLQPLVENAVRHGTASQPHLHVKVSARETNGALVLTVDDDGPGADGSRHQGTGTSQKDLRARLTLAYAGAAHFETSRSPLGGFRAALSLPRNAP